MSTITQDGYSFDSGWIDAKIADLTDPNAPRAWRRVKLECEISDHKSAIKKMLAEPDDLQAKAQAKAYLAALERALIRVHAEVLKPRNP
jgi:hypothetical protein